MFVIIVENQPGIGPLPPQEAVLIFRFPSASVSGDKDHWDPYRQGCFPPHSAAGAVCKALLCLLVYRAPEET